MELGVAPDGPTHLPVRLPDGILDASWIFSGWVDFEHINVAPVRVCGRCTAACDVPGL